MVRKTGFATSAVDFRTGKRRTFPKRFRKKTTATKFVKQLNKRAPQRKARVVKVLGRRSR